ncbi:MAG: pyruvate, water dikinase [Longimicrobiales bacterium]|nr:pyruvate, water dikinase [Longimicrobiales bacterium]
MRSDSDAAMPSPAPMLRWFNEISRDDTLKVGGKAASLGEMYQRLVPKGVRVPNGFATTVGAYRAFRDAEHPAGTWDEVLADDHLRGLKAEAARGGTLRECLHLLFAETPTGDHLDMYARTALARDFVLATPVPTSVREAVEGGYRELCEEYGREVDAAVRSSATREDSEMASFAGQYESYLNIRGAEEVLAAWKRCCASAFTERAVSYQLSREMDPLDGDLAVVIMKMVRSDIATSGVMFSLDPDSGNRNVIHVTSSYGLGELVVQGSVSPDTFLIWKGGLRQGRNAMVHRVLGAKDRKLVYSMQGGTATESTDVEAAHRRRWSLTREEALELSSMALLIEEHYGRPMDIEWAKDGYSGKLFIVQARPETVHSANHGTGAVLETYAMEASLVDRLKKEGRVLATGAAVGTRIGTGRVRVYEDYEEVIVRKRALRNMLKEGRELADIPPEERVFDPGDVLVTEMTTPDWEPMMKEASLVVTERGGRTSHAAIVARELGIPAIVGCDNATQLLEPLTVVTGSCAEGDTGYIFEGRHPFEVSRVELGDLPELRTRVKLNVGFPDKALNDAMLPSDGVGLARLEFILTAQVGIHPLALLYYDELREFCDSGEVGPGLEPFAERLRAEDPHELRTLIGAIERRTPAYADRRAFFVDQLKYGIALICAAFHPRPVLVRLSDLKSNEYRALLGGRLFEPAEENPMIAWRGASRYIDPRFRPASEMECEALRFVRQQIGLDNLQIMVPFCRSPEEGKEVVRLLDDFGLSPDAGVPLFLMVEVPSNVIEADRFIDEMQLAGGSIGSNDLVQTVYAVSRDDLEHYAHPVDARSPAVRAMIQMAVERFRAHDIEIGICGQAPSDYPEEIPAFLVSLGMTSISVTPDTLIRVRMAVAEAEAGGG